MLKKREKRIKRHRRARAKILGTAERPRLCIFRSNKHIYVQLIDDVKGKTLVSASDVEVKKPVKKIKTEKALQGKTAVAFELGKLIAEKAVEEKIKTVVFDRGGYKYHGRVKAAADGAREKGLKF